MKQSKIDSQCYKIKNFLTKNCCLVLVPYYEWPRFKRQEFQLLIEDCYKKLGGK